MNYTLNEYASDVVYRIKSVCDARDVPHPMIVSESGPRDRRASQRAGVRRPGRLETRPIQGLRAAGGGLSRPAGAAAAGARSVRQLSLGQRAPPGRVLPRCAAGARAGAADVQLGLSEPRVPRSGGEALLGDLRQDSRLLPQARPRSRGAGRPRGHAERHLFLQLLGVPVPAGQLGDRPAVSHHADPAAGGAADPQRGARRHHLRLGRQNRPLRQSAHHQAHS